MEGEAERKHINRECKPIILTLECQLTIHAGVIVLFEMKLSREVTFYGAVMQEVALCNTICICNSVSVSVVSCNKCLFYNVFL